MTVRDSVSIFLAVAGATFFLAGTVGILRFPDAYSRLHAVAKADNLGLGLIVVSLIVQADSVAIGLKLLLIWIFALISSATAAYLIANANARQSPQRPDRDKP